MTRGTAAQQALINVMTDGAVAVILETGGGMQNMP